MLAIFIDTNVFERSGFNFDEKNKILSKYKEFIETKKIQNIVVSIIDSEIKSHLRKKIDENKRHMKKYCSWISECLDEKEIEKNLNKSYDDYQKFKSSVKSININTKNINPEIVFEKHFGLIPPFELSKPNEFKDAFFLETIYKYAEENIYYSGYIVITEDKGVKTAIERCGNGKVKFLNSIQELIDMIVGCTEDEKNKIKKFLNSYDFDKQLEEKYSITTSCIEEEEIEIKKFKKNGVFSIDVINVLPEKITIVCNLGIHLVGNFKCLDYENSCYSYEDDDYIFKSYKKREWLGYVCQTVIDIYKNGDNYVRAEIIDLPEIDIDYEAFKSVEDYIVEARGQND